ncbi:MAG: hypothetical protein A2Z14_11105 [Chloroflexi bacterium RBG_16_48_8]|nr:MAG: hypothetical protein A2Z14_11105 [Chloroflexi bacterium RBG_16_48_8]
MIEQDNPQAPFQYDSSNPPDEIPTEAAGYHAMVGKGFSLLISPQGGTLEVAGLEEMYAAVVDEMKIEDEELRIQIEEMLNTQFGQEGDSDAKGDPFGLLLCLRIRDLPVAVDLCLYPCTEV